MIRKIYLYIKKKYLKVDTRTQLEIAIENGLKIGKNCHILGECIIDPGHCWLIEIGDEVTLAPRVHILAHDASTKRTLGFTRISRTIIGNNVFIGTGSIVLPGAHIGNNCIIGAGSVVSKPIPDNSIAAGNPAIIIGSFEEYRERKKEEFNKSPHFDESFIIGNITPDKKEEMAKILSKHDAGYII